MNGDTKKEFEGIKQWAEIESQLEYSRHKVALSKIEEMKSQEHIRHEKLYQQIHERHNNMMVFHASEKLADTGEFVKKFNERLEKDLSKTDNLLSRIEKLEDDD